VSASSHSYRGYTAHAPHYIANYTVSSCARFCHVRLKKWQKVREKTTALKMRVLIRSTNFSQTAHIIRGTKVTETSSTDIRKVTTFTFSQKSVRW